MLLVLFSNTALFSFIFRTVLIRFAERGLVLQGRPNLRLFDQLFWVILVPYCCIGLGMAPFLGIIRGTIHTYFDYKVCNFKSIADHDVLRKDIMPLMSPLLVWIYCIYWKFKTNRYLQGLCPQQNMSIFGKFRRNFTTFEQTTQFIQINFFYGILHQGVCFWLFQAFSLEPETNFLLANISDFLYMDIYHCIFLPMVMEIPPTLQLISLSENHSLLSQGVRFK